MAAVRNRDVMILKMAIFTLKERLADFLFHHVVGLPIKTRQLNDMSCYVVMDVENVAFVSVLVRIRPMIVW